MNQRTFGCTSLHVSELCLGTMNFGWRTDESTSLAILDAYHAAGGNFIQALGFTDPTLSSTVSPTFSETVVGRWWRSRHLTRADFVLATRLCVRESGESDSVNLAETVRRSCEESLRRLRTNYLDVLVCDWTGGHPPEALRRGLDWLVREGLVRYVALGNLPGWRLVASMLEGAKRNHARIDGIQADYSLLARTAFESDLAALCREHRLGFLASSPLAGGLLTRQSGASAALGRSRRAWLAERYGWDLGDRTTRALGKLAEETGWSPAQIALSWVLHHPHVTSLVVGLNSTKQLHEALQAITLRLGADELRQLHHASAAHRIILPPRSCDAGAPRPRAGAPTHRANSETSTPLLL